MFLCDQSTLLYSIKKTSKNFRCRRGCWKFQKIKMYAKIGSFKKKALNPPQNVFFVADFGCVYVCLSPTITFHNLSFQIATVL